MTSKHTQGKLIKMGNTNSTALSHGVSFSSTRLILRRLFLVMLLSFSFSFPFFLFSFSKPSIHTTLICGGTVHEHWRGAGKTAEKFRVRNRTPNLKHYDISSLNGRESKRVSWTRENNSARY